MGTKTHLFGSAFAASAAFAYLYKVMFYSFGHTYSCNLKFHKISSLSRDYFGIFSGLQQIQYLGTKSKTENKQQKDHIAKAS